MKIYVEDSGDMREPKAKEPKAAKSGPTRRSSRSAGFKRRKPIDDLDALVASGADGAETTAPEEPEAPGDFLPPDDSFSMPLGGTLLDEPAEDKVRAPLDTEVTVPGEENPTEEPAPIPPRRKSNLGSVVQSATEEEGAGGARPSRSNASKYTGGRGGSTQRKKKGVFPVESRAEEKPGRKQSLVREKPAKAQRTSKKAPKSKLQDDFAPKSNPVVVAPEPIVSQVVTLLEVIVGAALMFFGATQVGNILITNIVQGMLGG